MYVPWLGFIGINLLSFNGGIPTFQTNTCCNNGSANGNVVEDLKTQLTALQARVQTLLEVTNKTGTKLAIVAVTTNVSIN